MDQYDEKIPGRYAFGRVFGVELEIQADVGTGQITGYLENARLIPGKGRRPRAALDLARAGAGARSPSMTDEVRARRRRSLDDTMPKRPVGGPRRQTFDIALERDNEAVHRRAGQG